MLDPEVPDFTGRASHGREVKPSKAAEVDGRLVSPLMGVKVRPLCIISRFKLATYTYSLSEHCSTGNILPSPALSPSGVNRLLGRQILFVGSLLVVAIHDDCHSDECSRLPRQVLSTPFLFCRTALHRSPRSRWISRVAAEQFVATLPVGGGIHDVKHSSHSSVTLRSPRQVLHQSRARAPRTALIVQAVYHRRLLKSKTLRLSLYGMSPGSILHAHALLSLTPYPSSRYYSTAPASTRVRRVWQV